MEGRDTGKFQSIEKGLVQAAKVLATHNQGVINSGVRYLPWSHSCRNQDFWHFRRTLDSLRPSPTSWWLTLKGFETMEARLTMQILELWLFLSLPNISRDSPQNVKTPQVVRNWVVLGLGENQPCQQTVKLSRVRRKCWCAKKRRNYWSKEIWGRHLVQAQDQHKLEESQGCTSY